jgi:two-component system response regulator AtoC
MPYILVVDDDEGNRRFLARVLRLGGFGVREAGDFPAALESAITATPGLVLLDYRLGNHDGLGLVSLLRGRGVDCPVVLVTASLEEALDDGARKTDLAGLLAKPFTLDELFETVHRVLSR